MRKVQAEVLRVSLERPGGGDTRAGAEAAPAPVPAEPEAPSSASDVVLAETLEVRCVWTYLALTFLSH